MAKRVGVVDVRRLQLGEKNTRALRAFDRLEAGEAFVLVSDHEPRGFLTELQAKRPRQYEWNPIESGADFFRVEIERRSNAEPRTVREFLGHDLDRLHALLVTARTRAAEGALDVARAAFGELATGIVHHIRMEENVLFPAFEQSTGLRGGPTEVMRSEHKTIGQLVAEGQAALAGGDRNRFESIAAKLASVIAPHDAKETGVLDRMLDRSLGDDRAREDLVRVLQTEPTTIERRKPSRSPSTAS